MSKDRLFEVMHKVNPEFKKPLNENTEGYASDNGDSDIEREKSYHDFIFGVEHEHGKLTTKQILANAFDFYSRNDVNASALANVIDSELSKRYGVGVNEVDVVGDSSANDEVSTDLKDTLDKEMPDILKKALHKADTEKDYQNRNSDSPWAGNKLRDDN